VTLELGEGLGDPLLFSSNAERERIGKTSKCRRIKGK
jgi:hypothetical protein